MKKLLLPLILTCIFSTLLSGVVIAQSDYDSTINTQALNAYGFNWKNGKFRSTLVIPSDTFKLAVRDSGSIAYKSGKQYLWDGWTWVQSSGTDINIDPRLYFYTGIDTTLNAVLYENFYGLKDTVYYEPFDTTGGGGIGIDTTLYMKYTDSAGLVAPYLLKTDTTAKWFHSGEQVGDTIRLFKGTDTTQFIINSSPPNFPTVDDTLTANRQLYINTYNFRIKSQLNNLFTLNNTGLSYFGGNWSNAINNSYQEYLQGFGSTYSMFRLTTSNSRMYSQTSGVNYSFVDVAPTIITLRAKDSIQITSGVAEESLADDMKVLVRKPNNTVIEVDPSEFGGGGGTADTIYTKFPLRVDTTGANDSLKLKYPPNSVAVNLTNDTADVQFLTIKRVSNQVSPDTLRWVATTTIPSGTPEIYYSWSQIGKQVTVKIWAYYPTAGTAVTSAAINLPPDCPAPLVPGGWTTEAEMIVSVGSGGLYVNRTRSLNDLPTATASSVLRRNTDNTGWEIITKMSGGSYRYLAVNMIYEAQ